MTLRDSVNKYVQESVDYQMTWLFDQPIATHSDRMEGLRRAGLILNKLIHHAGTQFLHHDGYSKMTISDKAKEIMRVFNQRPEYEIGTYRTDFVFGAEAQPKFIEITCQFSMNAFFQSAIFNHFSQKYGQNQGLGASRVETYDDFIPFMEQKIGNARSICIIKGRDKIQASRFFAPIFRNAGYEVKEVLYTDVWANRNFIAQSFVISEIMIDEIESMSMDEIRLLADCNMVNDYRTIFIAHDKRYFTLLGDHELQKQVLTPQEMAVLNEFMIETHSMDRPGFNVQLALDNKDAWVLKHINLGRSRDVYAGLEFDQKGWEELLGSIDHAQFILQEWVPQKPYEGTIQGKKHQDYLTGTLLYFDKEYFGLGLFRASSHIVANKVDNRNIFPLVLQSPDQGKNLDVILRF
jgi:hypothetical protein